MLVIGLNPEDMPDSAGPNAGTPPVQAEVQIHRKGKKQQRYVLTKSGEP
jgi:hypothetical protein